MKFEESVALVVGADTAVGAAIVRGLLAREAVKVYAISKASGSSRLDPSALARELADVTLLIHCMVAVEPGASALAGADLQTLALIEAFAPGLAANGGGAVVNVLPVLRAGHAGDDLSPEVSGYAVDWMLAEALHRQLAAQKTLFQHFRVQLVVGCSDQSLDDQRALAGHIAMRVLNQIDPDDRFDRGNSAGRFGQPIPAPFRTGSRHASEHDD